jgi:hypothetical protein
MKNCDTIWNRTSDIPNEDRCTFVIISRSVLLTKRNHSNRSCKRNQSTHLYVVTFFANSTVYEVMWGKYGTTGQVAEENIIRHMRFACRVNKATETHSEYVIFVAFLRQRWLRERASISRYTYNACVVT